MPQYFEENPALKEERKNIEFSLFGQPFTLTSANGLFSTDRLDTGTRFLLETVLDQQKPAEKVLDMGCGIGTIGTVLSRFWRCSVTGVDINPRACALAKENFRNREVQGKVLCQDGLEDVSDAFDCILFNPPIHAGKETIYRLFSQCAQALKPDGTMWIVIRKQHGAQSALDSLNSIGFKAGRVARDKGFWIIEARKPQDKAAE